MSSPRLPFRVVRCLVAAVSGFLFAFSVMAAWWAWLEISSQDWDQPGLGWLKVDFWSRQMPWKEAAAGGALTLVLACLGEAQRGRGRPGQGMVQWGARVFGRPAGFLSRGARARLPQGRAALFRPAPAEGAPNVLFVLVDTWRSDHTSFLGYERETWPKLGELAEEAAVFERAVSQAPWTKPTVASLFTSLVPSQHGAMSHMSRESGKRFVAMGNEHTTLAERFASGGYETFAVTHNANIQPAYGFGQGFQSFQFLNDWNLKAATIIHEAQKWFDAYRGGRPFFAYVHLTDPHYPYDPPPPFKGIWDQSGMSIPIDHEVIHKLHRGELEFTAEEKQHLRDAYDEEMVYTDSVLTPFLLKIREQHPNTVIVLVGDHGDEFWEHGAMGHGHVLYDELTWVPLLIWAPGVEPQRVSSQVPLLDVAPTLLELAGLEFAPEVMMGESLLPLMRGAGGGHRPAPMETGGDGEPPWHLRGISMVHEGQLWKLIRGERDDWSPGGAPYTLLFNLDEDPEERHDRAAERPEIAAALFEEMKARGWYTHPDDLEGEGFTGELDAGTEENLQGLGYLDVEEEGGE